MSRLAKGVLAASAALNLALLILYFRSSEPPAGLVSSPAAAVAAPPPVTASLSEADKKVLVLAQIKKRRFAGAERSDANAYWGLPAETHAAAASAAQVRADLIQKYGDSAWEDTELAEVFRPLDAQLPFLSARKQVELERVFANSRARTRALANGADPLAQRQQAERIAADLDTEIRKILTPQEFVEYELRMSRLAQSLRMMNLELTERSYRELFAAIGRNDVLKATVTRTQMNIRSSPRIYDPAVEAILGPVKYTEFLKRVDPVFSMMTNVARNSPNAPIASSALERAYSETISTQQQIAKLRSNGDVAKISELVNKRRTMLREVFGEPAATMVESLMPSGSVI